MMIQTVRLTRKKAALAVIAAGTVLAALILILGRGGSGEEPSRPQLTGNAERVAYLQEMGWQVEETDPLKVTIKAREGVTGTALAELLRTAQIECEYADEAYLVLMVTQENGE